MVISSGFSFSRKALVQKKKGGWWGELRFVRYSLIPVQPLACTPRMKPNAAAHKNGTVAACNVDTGS